MVQYFKRINVNFVRYFTILFIISIVTATSGCTTIQNMQDKATSVATENMRDISTGLNIKSIEGIVGSDGKISLLYLRATTQAGSQSINLSEVIIHMSDGKAFFDLFYEPYSGIKHGFTANMLLDSGMKFTPSNPLVDKGDLMTITIDTIKNGIDLSSGDVLSISFESAKGNKAVPLVVEIETLMSGANKIY